MLFPNLERNEHCSDEILGEGERIDAIKEPDGCRNLDTEGMNKPI